MKRVSFTLALVIGTAASGNATPCVPDTLAAYIGLGAGGCSIGGNLFSEFAVLPVPASATPIPPGAVEVTPLLTPGGVGLEFVLDAAAGGGEFFDIVIGYVVSGSPLRSGRVRLLDSAVAPDGVNTGVLDLCLDGVFLGGTFCPGVPATLIAFDIGTDALLSDSTGFAAASTVGVVMDIGVDGGLGGSAALRGVDNVFGTVPEPSAVVFAGMGLALSALWRSSGRRGRGRREDRMSELRIHLSILACLAAVPALAANHREAPITALDHKADITDVYAFRSYDPGSTLPAVTLILCVDPFLEPANGPNWFPFDPEMLYEIHVDNNHDAVADISFQFRFSTVQGLPNLFQVYAGAGGGVVAPGNSPPPVPPGTLIVPPQITSFSSPGLGQRQSYTVTMMRSGVATPLSTGSPMYAVPANVGPRTMNYDALFNAGTYSIPGEIRVFAGTTDDAFWIDLGGAFDTLNLRSTVAPGVLTPVQDASLANFASDTVSGYGVNSIAIEVPVSMLTATGAVEPASSPAATIGVWATTSRPRTTVRRPPLPAASSGTWAQVQRMGNPLINELLVGTGFKNRFSMDQPKNDAQFASFFLDPALARILNALTGGALTVPPPPRLDLLPLVTYAPPIAAPGTPPGPVADLLRLNTGVPPTAPASGNRLGLLGGDAAGYPNGRRLFDDVTDISLRAVAGVLNPAFNVFPNNRLGDGVNVNDAPYRVSFPNLANAPSGRDRRHLDPGEPGCTAGVGAPCPF